MQTLTEDIHSYLNRHQNKQLLRFLTCGSVDDGKSTLIGRLLHDTKTIYEDQLAAVKRDTVKHGTTGGPIDLALLTDGLKAEREQGITIDVAYRYFSTDKRKFIIADTPGHEQYTRNMATGASNCDLAIILIDARHGVVTQTRRHSFIVSLLGIQHVIVAVNKMDLVGYSQETFARISADYEQFIARLGIRDVSFIPLSALNGDNVVDRTGAMPWYQGPTLLEQLETVSLSKHREDAALRFPVQYVLRPNLNFRGFSGTVASGTIGVGDEVAALPSGRKSRVKSIVTFDGPLQKAYAGQAVTVTLEDEIDISRGDTIVHPDKLPLVSRDIEAMLVWMTDTPATLNKSYLIKQCTRVTTADLAEIRHSVDVNSLEERTATELKLNEVGRVVLRLAQPLTFDPYSTNRTTGAFIIIDKLTNNTVGAGMIVGKGERVTFRGRVTQKERDARLGQHGQIIAAPEEAVDLIERELFDAGRTAVHLNANLPSIATIAKALADQSLIVIVATQTPEIWQDETTIVIPDREATHAMLIKSGLVPPDEGFAAEGI